MRKGWSASPSAPLDAYQIDKLLARIGYAATALGVLAVVATQALCNLISLLLRGGLNPAPFLLSYIWEFALLALALALLYRHTKVARRVEAHPQAAEYFRVYAVVRRRWVALAGIVWLACIALLVVITLRLRPVYGIMPMQLSAFIAAFQWYKNRAYRAVELVEVSGDGAAVYDRHRANRRWLARWAVYWLAVLALYALGSFIFQSTVLYLPVLAFCAANFALRALVSNPRRPFFGVRARRLTAHLLNLACTLGVLELALFTVSNGAPINDAWLAGLDYSPFHSESEVRCDADTGVYTVRASRDDFRILQLTDIHICGSVTTAKYDRMAFQACYDLIRRAEPDLIIVTGDLVYPIPAQTFSANNLLPMRQFAGFMNRVGIPWAFVYGNHDTEPAARYGAGALEQMLLELEEEPGCPLLYARKRPEIFGRYNQYIRIESADGSLNRTLFLIDSNDYAEGSAEFNDYDCVHRDQIDWYTETVAALSEAEGRTVPSFVYLHIPFPASAEAKAALDAGEPEAEYLFGENGEGVSCPDRDEGLFDAILEAGSTQAVFAGHDHLNNLGVRYKGVDLVYFKSIDYTAYPGIAHKSSQRGATLVTLDSQGGYAIDVLDYPEPR